MVDSFYGGGGSGSGARAEVNEYFESIGHPTLDRAGWAEYTAGKPYATMDPDHPDWGADVLYPKDSMVRHAGALWKSQQQTIDTEPGTNDAVWLYQIGGLSPEAIADITADVVAAGAAQVQMAEAQAGEAAAQASASDTARQASQAAQAAAAQAAVEAAAAAQGAVAASRTAPSWAALLLLTGAVDGEGAEVLDADAGSHNQATVSGYDGALVANAGRYMWSAAWARWLRIADTGLSGKADASALSAETGARATGDLEIVTELRAAVDEGPVEDAGDETPVGLIPTQDGSLAAIVKRSGAWLLPLLELLAGAGVVQISGTDDGQLDLGRLILGDTDLPGLTLFGEDGEIALRLDGAALLSAAGGLGIGRDLTLEPIQLDGILAILCDEAGNVGGYLSTEMVWVGPDAAADVAEAQLIDELQDELTSLRIVLIGDSITWGATASGIGPTTPREHLLSDVRDLLTSNSWANRLRRWLAAVGLGQQAVITETAPGRGEARQDQTLDPLADDRCVVVGGAKSGATVGGSLFGQVLDLGVAAPLEVRFRGDAISLIYARQTTDAAATASVYLDGVLIGTLAHGGASAAQGLVTRFDVAYGQHTLRVVNNAPTQPLRLEGVRHHRLISLHNQGLYGSNTGEWVPGSANLTGALGAQDDWCLIMLGTNDRAARTYAATFANLLAIAQSVQALGVRVVMMAANAMPTSDATLPRDAADVARTTRRVARALGLPMIDHYETTLRAMINGADILADNVHPDDAGHDIILAGITDAIIEKRI